MGQTLANAAISPSGELVVNAGNILLQPTSELAEHKMSHKHENSPEGIHAHTEHSKPQKRKLHKDWRLWVIVLLMLGLMIYYLATLDLR